MINCKRCSERGATLQKEVVGGSMDESNWSRFATPGRVGDGKICALLDRLNPKTITV